MEQLSRREFMRWSAKGGAVLLVTPALLSACGDDGEPPSGDDAGLATVRFQASWINDAEFMGYFIAIDKGYYEDEGLEVQYAPGGPDVIPESTLLSNSAMITLTTPETTIKTIVDDGAPFKIIGTQFQKNPIGVVALEGSNISSPEDLVGKTLAVPPVNTLTVEAMLRLNDIDKDDVNIVPYQYDPTPLIEGEVDATIDFTVNVPYTIEQAGAEATSFLLYDFGFTTYNDTVVVTTDTLESSRDLLVKWLRASRKGWEENFKDPTAYPSRFADSWFEGNGRTIENEIFYNEAAMPLIDHPDGVFTMTAEDIGKNLSALAAVGINGTAEMFDTTLLEEI